MRSESDFSFDKPSGALEANKRLNLADRLTVLMGYGQLVRMEPSNPIYHLKLQRAIDDLVPALR